MNRILKNIIKSIFFGILTFFGFFYTLGYMFNGTFGVVISTGVSTIIVIIFCTFTIIDTIKEYCDK